MSGPEASGPEVRRARTVAARGLAGAAAALSIAVGLASATAWSAPKAKSKATPKPPSTSGPPTTLKAPGRLSRVRVDVSPGGAAVLHEIVFPKDAVVAAGPGQPTVYVAFPAQVRPLAIEVTRHAVDAAGASLDAGATKLETIDAYQQPKTAALLLGPASQAGHVVRLPRESEPFALRIRTAIATTPVESPSKSVSFLVRLGVRDRAAMPLERVEIGALPGASIRGARAILCGEGADPRPLTVTFPGYPSPSAATGTISPLGATRTVEDDLCVDVLI